jgi:hypothetical protein
VGAKTTFRTSTPLAVKRGNVSVMASPTVLILTASDRSIYPQPNAQFRGLDVALNVAVVEYVSVINSTFPYI